MVAGCTVNVCECSDTSDDEMGVLETWLVVMEMYASILET